MVRNLAALALLAATTVSCDNGAPHRATRNGPTGPRGTVTLKGTAYDVGLRFTEKDRRRPLSDLPRLQGEKGVLLGWPEARRLRLAPGHARSTFRTSFTAAFLDREGKVVDLQLVVEGTIDAVRSKADAAYALLLSPGVMRAPPFSPGDPAAFSPELKANAPEPIPALTLGGKTYSVLTFFTERTRQHAPEAFEASPPGEAYLLGWDHDRAIKLETARASTSFTVVFLDLGGKVVDLKPFGHGDPEGIMPATDAAYALFLPKSVLDSGSIKSGDAATFSPELRKSPPQRQPIVKVGSHEAHVELALTEAERQQGLMFRGRLSPEKDGMFFAYDRDANRQFWMGNTLIPLDIAFFSEDGTLLNVNETPIYPDPRNPPSPYPTSDSAGPARYVLEMNLGWFRKKGIIDDEGRPKPGVRGHFPPEAVRGRYEE